MKLRSVLRAVQLWFLLAFTPASLIISAQSSGVVTNWQQLLSLSEQAARAGAEVRLTGTVLYFDPEWNLLFVYVDGTGVYFAPPKKSDRANYGDLVELTGQTAWSGSGSTVSLNEMRIIGKGKLPQAWKVPLQTMLKGGAGIQWVEVQGLVRTMEDVGRLRFYIMLGTNRVPMFVLNHSRRGLDSLFGAKILVNGVCGNSYDSKGNFVGINLWVPDEQCIQIVKPGGVDNALIPQVKISQLRQLTSSNLSEPLLVKVVGRVTKQDIGESITVNDNTGEIVAESRLVSPLSLGDRVEVWGFPAIRNNKIVLEDSMYRKEGEAAPAYPGVQSFPVPKEANTRLPTLTSIQEVKRLKPEEAVMSFPVKVEGVVTYYDADWYTFFIQDNTGGIYVNLAGAKYDFKPGDKLQIDGVSNFGGFAPVIMAKSITKVGSDSLPMPERVNLLHLHTGAEDSQFGVISGRCVGVSNNLGRMTLSLNSEFGKFLAIIPGFTPDTPPLNNLIGAKLDITGVCAAIFNPQGQLLGVQIFVPNMSYIDVVEPAPKDLFEIPVTHIASINTYNYKAEAGKYFHVVGQVAYSMPGQMLGVQDDTGGILAYTEQTNLLDVGEFVHVVGFVEIKDGNIFLSNAKILSTGSKSEPKIEKVTPEHLLKFNYHARLVRLEARVMESGFNYLNPVLILVDQKGKVIFQAEGKRSFAKEMLKFRTGSIIELTGLCYANINLLQEVVSFKLLINSKDAIKLIESPPIISQRFAIRASVVFLLVIFFSLLWVYSLRRHVAWQTREIKTQYQKLAELGLKYSTLFQGANDLIVLLDVNGLVLEINNVVSTFFNKHQEEVIGTRFDTLFPIKDRPALEKATKDCLNGAGTSSVELSIENNGSTRFIDLDVQKLSDSQGQVYLFCIGHDITDRKLAEEELLKHRQLFEDAENIGKTGSWEFDLENQKLIWSKGAFKIFGTDPRFFKPSIDAFMMFVHPEDKKHVQDLIKTGMEKKSFPPIEYRIVLPDKSIKYLHSEKRMVLNSDGKPVKLIGIIRDITEQKEMELQIRQLQKIEVLGQLAGGIAHDFNNILTVIRGHVGLLKLYNNLPNEIQDSIKQISDASEKASNLTRQLLTFSRKQEPQRAVHNLIEVVSGLSKILAKLVGDNINIEFNFPSQPLYVYADRGMIEQVIMNLSVNARDAMPQGGKLTIGVSRQKRSGPLNGRDDFKGTTSLVCLEVTDTGIGMTEEVLEHIFEPFFTTKSVGSGTGLGLATVYRIVKQHNGSIKVDSSPGKGSTFRIYFEEHVGEKNSSQDSVSEKDKLLYGSGTILVVEDEPMVRALIKGVLTKHGYKVIDMALATEALAISADVLDSIDLLLTDISMPGGVSGIDLARQFKTTKNDLKVIYISGFPITLDMTELVEGINFIRKPFQPEELLDIIKNMLGNKS